MPIQLNRRAIRNLFFYLACQPESDRNRLCTLFWPELPEEESRPLLRTTLSKLRKALPDPSLVEVNGETVRLDRNRTWVDVQEFRALARRNLRPALQIPNQQPLPEGLAQQLRQAASLWTTTEFWPGVDFEGQPELEEWARDLRQEVSYDFMRVLERLAYHSAASGDLELALSRARRVLQLDPLNDEMHGRVFQWLLDSGQRSKALEYCQVICETYRRQETTLPIHLAEICDAAKVAVSQLQTQPANPWLRSIPTNLPYIHRPVAEQILIQSYQRGGKLVVAGEAGVGKTRLMVETFRGMAPSPRLMLIDGHPGEQALPYQALINALRHQVLQEEWLKLEDIWVSHLARLLPELAVLRPDVEMPAHQIQGESPLYEALHQLLVTIAQTNRLVFIMDNAHSIDQASLNAVTYLCNRGFFNHHRLLVVAYRSEGETPGLKQFLSAAPIGTPANRLNLEPFKTEEVNQLAQRVLGHVLSPETTSRLMEETGGNPLLLIESLYWLLSNPALDGDQIEKSPPISANLHALIHDRLQRLSPVASQVINIAAVAGEVFTVELIEKAGNVPIEQVVQSLEELEQARLIRPAAEPTTRQTYRFVNSKIREVLLLEMGQARQRMHHLRIARVLEKLREPAPELHAVRLAEHYEGAGEFQAAYDHWIKAGEHALSNLSPVEAQAAFEHAEHLLQQHEQAMPEHKIYLLYKEWNQALKAAGDPVRMQEINQRLLEMGEKRLSPLLCGAGLTGLARAALFQNQIQQSLQYCDRAAIHLQQVDDQFENMKMRNIRGDCLMLLDRYDEAVEAFTQAIALSTEKQDAQLLDGRAHSEYSLSEAYLARGYPAQARDLDLRCIQTSFRSKSASWALKAHMMAALSEYYLGHMDEALDHTRQGTKLAESLENWRNLAYIKITQARIELALGWIDDSWRDIQLAEELGVKHALPRVLSWTASHRGQMLRFLRQYEQATREYQTGLANSVFALDRLECQFRLGLSLEGEGKVEESQQMLLDCMEKAEKTGIILLSLLAETALLLVQVKYRQLDKVHSRLPGFLERASGRQIAEVDIGATSIQAMLALRENRLAEGLVYARQALERSVRSGILWWELIDWQVLALLGEDKSPIHKRVEQLTGILMAHGQTPEFAGYIRSFIAWTNREVGYT